ncbi:MAG: adenosine kinase [Acidimicrobiales bacterium]|nr:adenosine kinase [Acidimicrobiales bacterium]|tara:strand:+ start:426 stop:1445 length:1020 start_codon:yes stop_codon:yes gene_type:complete
MVSTTKQTDTKNTYDVVGIGNAIVDVISHEDEKFLDTHNLIKDSMALINTDTAVSLYNEMSPTVQSSGGSAANTMSGVASLGGKAAYIGKIRDDHLGEFFAHDINAAGVHFKVKPASEGLPTARSMIIVTPDGSRTMNTYLGISTNLSKEDLDVHLLENAQILYCEGYIWDIETTKDTIRSAIAIAKGANRTISFTLSDSFCVSRHKDEWIDLINEQVDILFGNEDEIKELSGCGTLSEAAQWIQGKVKVACLTLAERGSIIVTEDEIIGVGAKAVNQVTDSTGAGDLYASGFLFGYARGLDLKICGELASIAAAEIITHTGARPLVPLKNLIESEFRN